MAETEENSEEKATRFKEKHSLDSDEEDEDGKKYDVLADDDIEGQFPFSFYEQVKSKYFLLNVDLCAL